MAFPRFFSAVTIGVAALSTARAQTASPLRVIRTTPAGDASPLTQISVTFNKPVAGSLDRTVDPAAILRVEPAVPGKLDWRDPVTIRLVPAAPLSPGATYTVTVSSAFQAMDGSALAEPYRFTFRVQGPRLIGGVPVAPWIGPGQPPPTGPVFIRPDQSFSLVYSAPLELAKLTGSAYLEFSAGCSAQRIVRLRAADQRRIGDKDDWNYRDAGGWRRDRAADSLRRVVLLQPETTLPHGCPGELVAPLEIDDQLSRGYARLPVETYGDFRLNGFHCGGTEFCPTGPLRVDFTTPVRGSEVQRHVRVLPETKFAIRDTSAEAMVWYLEGDFKPRVNHAVVVDTAIRDVLGQPLRGNPAAAYRTTGFAPSWSHPFGNLVVERAGLRTLSVQHINIDTLIAVVAPVPDSLEAKALGRFGWSDDSLWTKIALGAPVQRIPVASPRDRAMVSAVKLPAPDARRPGAPTLFAVRVSGRGPGRDAPPEGAVTLVQVTDLGVHARIGVAEGAVWVTGLKDGNAKPGALVVLYDATGRRLASTTTDLAGLARLRGWPVPPISGEDDDSRRIEGYVEVTLADDRAVTALSRWDPDLSPWRFGIDAAYGEDRVPLAGAVFTERGIYRPGERVYAKAIVRDGALGALKAPAAGDSLKWRFHDREDGLLREVTGRLSAFGTADQTLQIPAAAAVGYYSVEIQSKRRGLWWTIGQTGYRVAEYRPPEFLVDMTASTTPRFPRDTFAVTVQARYLFGAPMGRAELTWMARQSPMSSWEYTIPGLDGWYVGGGGAWDERIDEADVFATGTDTLDARGERVLKVVLPIPPGGRAARVEIEAAVSDINRQVVGTRATTIVHPAAFYIAVKPKGADYFWKAGSPQVIDVVTARPDGERQSGIPIVGTVARREWHRVRRERFGMSELVGEWVVDTVATCTVVSAATPVPCAFTPQAGGVYSITFRATDAQGRPATTSFMRWAAGSDWVPWNDESQFKMDVIPDRERYSVGDTATVLFASPFTNAEAWITVEREGVIEQRRMRLTSGATTIKLPITEAFAPNAFVSMIVTRGRSAPPGPLDDPGRPTIRVGYAALRVTPEVKRLSVALAPTKAEYRPGDTARVQVRVRDAAGTGQRSEVTLWAVDEGVLALTGFKTPDPIDLIYRERGLGLQLRSNMTAVAPQVPEGEKGKRDPGGGGGAAGADVLRSRFQTTAFFLGSVVTDAQGNAIATAKLPDNLATFRLMAVAVTAGDRYGKGESQMLVTRPLLARQALPRFVRPGDDFIAGAVINRRDGAVATVEVRAAATGVTMTGPALQTATLAASRGAEVRFPFRAIRGDSATFRFDVAGVPAGPDTDAVRVSLPVRPDHHPRAHTIAGVLRDSASVEFQLPADIDPARSRLSLSLGVSPLAMIRGMSQSLRIYPYYCSEQVISTAIPLIALYRAQRQTGVAMLPTDPRPEIIQAVATLTRRQNSDGGIGYWSADDWSTAWLSAYAGAVLLDARDLGIPVDTMVLSRLAAYVAGDLRGASRALTTPVASWYVRRELRLRDQVAAADFLSRLGRPDVPAENELLRAAAMLDGEDRARLAEVLMRRNQPAAARRLLTPIWESVQIEGRRAVVPDSGETPFYFGSRVRPIARLLTATLAVDPRHPLIGPLVETLVQQSRASRAGWMWNTQDYASAVTALAAIDRLQRAQGERTVTARAGNRTIVQSTTSPTQPAGESSVALSGLLANAPGGQALRVQLDAGSGEGSVYYYLTVTEIPSVAPVTTEDHGIRVERWYERFDNGVPTTSATEGELVRVRLRISVPSTRQFVVLDDALPAGLEAVDLSLRTSSAMPGPGSTLPDRVPEREDPSGTPQERWSYGSWDSGWWSPFDHREIRDDRVVYSATVLWAGTYTATYLARATTPGTFIKPPAHAEEMYNPGVNGRSDGGTFVVRAKSR